MSRGRLIVVAACLAVSACGAAGSDVRSMGFAAVTMTETAAYTDLASIEAGLDAGSIAEPQAAARAVAGIDNKRRALLAGRAAFDAAASSEGGPPDPVPTVALSRAQTDELYFSVRRKLARVASAVPPP